MEYSCFIGTKFLEPSEENSEPKFTWYYQPKVAPRYIILGIDLAFAEEDNRRAKVVIGQ